MMRKFIFFIVALFVTIESHAQITLWVGESHKCDATGSVLGFTRNVSWSTNGGYLSLSGSGFYRDVTVTQYFSGNATVTCEWLYSLTGRDPYKKMSNTWTIRCNDNPVSIYPTSLTLSPGQEKQLTYTLKYSNNYTYAAKAYFSSNNSNVAAVTEDGRVVARKEGTAYINVYSKVSANSPYCLVTVKKVNPTSVSVDEAISIVEGDTFQLTAKPYPEGASTSYTWNSEDPLIATVDSNGLVKGIKKGKTKVIVTTTVGSFTDYCNVTVKEPPVPPTKVKLKNNFSIYEGLSTTLTPILEPENAESKYNWLSSNPTVASVSSKGVVTAKSKGTTDITVTTENKLTATVKVTVMELPSHINLSELKSKIDLIENIINTTLNYVEE